MNDRSPLDLTVPNRQPVWQASRQKLSQNHRKPHPSRCDGLTEHLAITHQTCGTVAATWTTE